MQGYPWHQAQKGWSSKCSMHERRVPLHLICKEHKEINKNHPFGLKATAWIKDRNRELPVLTEAGTPEEFALLTSSSDMPTYNTTAFTDAAKIAFAAIAYTVKALSKSSPLAQPQPSRSANNSFHHPPRRFHQQWYHAFRKHPS
jgi:hypothetical protein